MQKRELMVSQSADDKKPVLECLVELFTDRQTAQVLLQMISEGSSVAAFWLSKSAISALLCSKVSQQVSEQETQKTVMPWNAALYKSDPLLLRI